MNKKVVAVGVLAGGIALTGLAGSAYAEGSAPPKKPTVPAKGHGPTAVVCYGTAGPGRGKPGAPEKGTVRMLEKGKFPPPAAGRVSLKVRGGTVLSSSGGAKAIRIIRKKDGQVTVVSGKAPKGLPPLPPLPPKGAPKGVHCTKVKPGTTPPAPVR